MEVANQSEEIAHTCHATEEKVLASLWKLLPFKGLTVFMLEVRTKFREAEAFPLQLWDSSTKDAAAIVL